LQSAVLEKDANRSKIVTLEETVESLENNMKSRAILDTLGNQKDEIISSYKAEVEALKSHMVGKEVEWLQKEKEMQKKISAVEGEFSTEKRGKDAIDSACERIIREHIYC